jgi:hypothetical protein
LLAAFYFRQTGKIEGERTFEFTHKSFGEYLIARRLVRAIKDIHDDRELNRKNRQRGKTIEDALVRWIELTGPTALDDDLLAFLNREIALQEETCHGWRESFNELFGEQLSQGLPMHRLQLSTYNEMNRQARNVEEILLAVICAAVTENNPVKIDNLNLLRMRDLFARLESSK